MLKSLNLKAYLLPLLILFLLFLGFTSLSKPANIYCRFCHSQQYSTWQANKHKDVDCYYCHGQPAGLAGWLKQKAEEGRMLALTPNQLLSGKPVLAIVKNNVCLHCHQQLTVKVIEKNNVLVSHREFINFTNCNDCHLVSHTKDKAVLEGMKGCLSCHKDDIDTEQCDVCHLATGKKRSN